MVCDEIGTGKPKHEPFCRVCLTSRNLSTPLIVMPVWSNRNNRVPNPTILQLKSGVLHLFATPLQ
jgi:hypothetical protein